MSFIATAIPGQYFARKYHSLSKGLAIGFMCGLAVYIIGLFYTFFTVEFDEV
jgi:hypothetical protein